MPPAKRVNVVEGAAFELGPYCGDCIVREFYVLLGESRVIISFSLEQGLPYTYEQQEQLYRRILRTIRPAGSSSRAA